MAPTTPFHWLPTRQPIVLSEWRPRRGRPDTFTTVMSLASYKPVTYKGRLFGQKDLQLRRYLELPSRVRPAVLEIALGRLQHAEWQSDDYAGAPPPSTYRSDETRAGDALARAGFRLVDAGAACPDIDSYRDYIETSMAEWSVAKHGYVAGQAGWFSDRSACYMAAGKPVVLEDTGFEDVFPTGEGLLAFHNLDGAIAAIEAIRADYPRHAVAARDIAVSCFDSNKVLTQLIEIAMGSASATNREQHPPRTQ
jgi:hypothetical protein